MSDTLRRGLAYHLNSSKIQDLGNLHPTDYGTEMGIQPFIEASFPYTTWMGGFRKTTNFFMKIMMYCVYGIGVQDMLRGAIVQSSCLLASQVLQMRNQLTLGLFLLLHRLLLRSTTVCCYNASIDVTNQLCSFSSRRKFHTNV